MKWIYIDRKFIPVQNCTNISFGERQRENEYVVTMIVEDINGNITRSSFYSTNSNLDEYTIRCLFYEFIADINSTVFDFWEVCNTILTKE